MWSDRIDTIEYAGIDQLFDVFGFTDAEDIIVIDPESFLNLIHLFL